MTVPYPALLARTQNFSLGRPHRFTVAPDGSRVLFLRSGGGEDAAGNLWVYEVAAGQERLLVEAAALPAAEGELPERERARRERARDASEGIGSYATDAACRTAVFTVGGRLYCVDVESGELTVTGAREPAAEARIDPTGSCVAYVCDDELRVVGRDGKDDRPLAEPDGPEVTWGLPEHEASESMDRFDGYWWAPDGRSLVAARVDNAPVQIWYVADPARPDRPPTALRYPSAGTPNADVSLHVLGLDGSRTRVAWDAAAYEYVTRVRWDATALLVTVQNRRQTVMRVLAADPATGQTRLLQETTDPQWTTIVSGVPAHTASGVLLHTIDDEDTRRLTADGSPVTPAGLQVEEVLSVDGDTVLFAARDEPTSRHLWTWSRSGGPVRVTSEPGVYAGVRAGGVTVVDARTLDGERVTVDSGERVAGERVAGDRVAGDRVAGDRVAGASWLQVADGSGALVAGGSGEVVSGGSGELRSLAAVSPVRPVVRLAALGERELRTAVLFPTGHVPGSRSLPVLMDPYGGSAAQRAVATRTKFFTSQWFADQGFAVVVADGRGTPGRGPRWERARGDDHAGPRLQDQVDALHAAAAIHPDLDLTRVGIRGWSAGGYLAALAVLRRPDVFHAAVAGAPVTDQLLYSTHWQERTLGMPAENPQGYAGGSLIADAPNLRRPLLLIHGMLDDNVLPVHTMKLSAALLAAGRAHTVLPLPGVTHMGGAVERLEEFELDFLRRSLGIA